MKIVNISLIDYVLARLAVGLKQSLWHLGNIETSLLREQLSSVAIARPIFVCGLARSGSTMLLELLAQLPGMATHRYRDFPFLTIPIAWNWFLDRTSRPVAPQTRAHRDLIQITPQSPEGMEEILWQRYSSRHAPQPEDRFRSFYVENLRKLMSLRGGDRYLSKNNYHWQRIDQLCKFFPDAQFIVPIRHPFSHVESLMRQHALFCELSQRDRRVAWMMSAAGHYEFGPQRAALGLCEEKRRSIEQQWACGDDLGGYATLWAEVYGRLWNTSVQSVYSSQLHFVKYEEFCSRPDTTWNELINKAQLPAGDVNLDRIARPPLDGLSVDQRTFVWKVAGAVAENFGYEGC